MGFSGKVVFTSGRSTDLDIWLLDISSGRLTQLTHGQYLNDHAKWSPDGKQVAFVSTREDSIPSLWIMDGDGGNQRQLTSGVYCQQPTWSPDGERIYFAGNGVIQLDMAICSYSMKTGEVALVCDYPGIESAPSCSPDGETLVFATTSKHLDVYRPVGATDIVEYNLKARHFKTLCEHPAQDNDPVYCPDGTRLAYTSQRNASTKEEFQAAFNEYRDIVMNGSNAEARAAMDKMKSFQGDSDIYLVGSDGGGHVALTHDKRADRGICWSPCGNYIMYTSHRMGEAGTDRLRVVNSHTGEKVPFEYDRGPLEAEIEGSSAMNRSWLQKLTPDRIEKMFIDATNLGAERNPDWTK